MFHHLFLTTDSPLCIQSSIPNEHGASMQCCYRDDESLVLGYEALWTSSFTERQYYVTGQFYNEEQYVNYLGKF